LGLGVTDELRLTGGGGLAWLMDERRAMRVEPPPAAPPAKGQRLNSAKGINYADKVIRLLLLFTGYVQLLVYTLGTQNTGHHLIPEVRERETQS